MTKARAGLLGGIAFVGAQAASLLANYGFQLLAARRLPAADYVSLFRWLSELAAYGVASIVALNVALTAAPPRSARRPLSLALAVVVAAGALGALLVPWHGRLPLVAVLGVAVAFGYASGAALAQQAFALTALASTTVFVVRIAWFWAAPRLDVGERATLLGFTAGLAALLVAFAFGTEPGRAAPVTTRREPILAQVVRASVLSAIQAVAPVADYLLVQASVPPDLQPAWASGSLLMRVPLVLGMAVLQVCLAKRFGRDRSGEDLPTWVSAVEVAMPAGLVLLALVPSGAAFPRLLALVVGGAPSWYVALPFASMLASTGAMLALLAVLQIAHVARDLKGAAVVALAGALAAVAISRTGALPWSTQVLALAIVWTSCAAVLLWRLRHVRPRSSAARVRPRSDAERGEDARSGPVGGAAADSRKE